MRTPGIITTYAGNNTFAWSGNGGPATSAGIDAPTGLAIDKAGNLYIADPTVNRIRKVDTQGVITTIAGTGIGGSSGNGGAAINAELGAPNSIAIDPAGNIYVGELDNSDIRKIDTSGIITLYAGNGSDAYSGDNGPATSAAIGGLWVLTCDNAGNLYIGDIRNGVVRKVDTGGTITTFAGNGTFGYLGDGGLATSASIGAPLGLTTDHAGNVYIADGINHVVRKVNPAGIGSRHITPPFNITLDCLSPAEPVPWSPIQARSEVMSDSPTTVFWSR